MGFDMRRNRKDLLILFRVLVLSAFSAGQVVVAENIDPDNDDSQYAWAENVGWVNAEPNGYGGDGMQVGDSELSGRRLWPLATTARDSWD